MPVTIMFQPYNDIPPNCATCISGGVLQVTAPPAFEFVSPGQSGECAMVHLFETGMMSNTFGAYDLLCEVDGTRRLLLHMTSGDRHIESGKLYTLIVLVHNPEGRASAADWEIDSYVDNTRTSDKALDESVVGGYPINPVLNTWVVRNAQGEKNGMTTVRDVDFTMNFPDPLQDGDVLQVWGPRGFNLLGNPELQQ